MKKKRKIRPLIPSYAFSPDYVQILRRMENESYHLKTTSKRKKASDRLVEAFHIIIDIIYKLILAGDKNVPVDIVGDLIQLVSALNQTALKNKDLQNEAWLRNDWPVIVSAPLQNCLLEIKKHLASIQFGGGHRRGKKSCDLTQGIGRFVYEISLFGCTTINGKIQYAPWQGHPFTMNKKSYVRGPLPFSSAGLKQFLDNVIPWLKSILKEVDNKTIPEFLNDILGQVKKGQSCDWNEIKNDFWNACRKELKKAIQRQPALWRGGV